MNSQPPRRRPPQTPPYLQPRPPYRDAAQPPQTPLRRTPEQRRRAALRRRRQQLRRRRLALLAVLAAALVVLAFFITELLKKSGAAPSAAASSAAAAASSAPASSVSPAAASSAAAAASSAAASAAAPVSSASTAALQGDDVWQLRLVNHTHPLAENFTVETAKLDNGKEFDARAIGQLNKMLADGDAAGLQLLVCSAYRSIARQDALFEEMKQSYIAQGLSEQEAYDKTATIRTPHACSEHSTGLAADIVSVSHQNLDDAYADTPEAKWLLAHAAEYGFILRYPKDKESVTGIIWEPWHYRYVGVENAQKIAASGLCLEEYLARFYGVA